LMMSSVARFDLADSAWKVRSGFRVALLNYLLASRSLELLRSEELVRDDQVNILEQRLSVGEIPRPQVDLARIELSQNTLGDRQRGGPARRSQGNHGSRYWGSSGGASGLDFSWPDLDSPPSAESFSPRQIQRDAVLNRLDVRRSLAQYAAAEAGL